MKKMFRKMKGKMGGEEGRDYENVDTPAHGLEIEREKIS